MKSKRTYRNAGAASAIIIGLFIAGVFTLSAQTRGNSKTKQQAAEVTAAQAIRDVGAIQRTTAEIMADPNINKPRDPIILNWEMPQPDRKDLSSRPGALEQAQFPPAPREQSTSEKGMRPGPRAPQTLSTQFDGATGPTETGAFPPDTEGVVGPTQFFVFLNGRLRTFSKTTGLADGVINADSDVFFASVMTPPNANEIVFTSDPNVRYDRLSGRWFLNIIDVILNPLTGDITRPNRVLLAVGDGASNGTISGSTTWTFYQFQGDGTLFTDYQSLGIDASALYIGADMFTLAGNFNSTKGFVIPKAPLLTASPATVWAFSGLVANSNSPGPFAPRGVDNYDRANTGPTALGYFIGVDQVNFSTLAIRRVTNPGSLGPVPPTMSANILVATPLTTSFPVKVPHLGNTGGTNGRLDALDDRLLAAHLRNGRLWTAHNVGVNNFGAAQPGSPNNSRNAARWYELQNLSATPSVLQSGTLFDNNAVNDANQRNYWIPSIMVSGQGHAALGCSIAGANERVNAFTTGRLVGDTLGTLQNGPGGAALPGYTASATAYNPPGDPGGGGGRRWGDYSFTSLDPKDDMTMWTIQEYCNGANTYGTRVVKLLAPLPVNPNSANPPNVAAGQSSVNVVLTGVSSAGSGFYDPGANLAPPALPFNHIRATVSGGVVVNSTTFNTPTQITLNINTNAATLGGKTVTITNPDGQAVTSTAILNIINPLQLTGAVSRKNHPGVGNFSINLLTANFGPECRSSSGKHTFVFTFSNNVTSGSASVTSGVGSLSGPPTFSTNTMTVNLTGVSDIQKIGVTLSGVTDSFAQVLPSTAASANMLIGDTTANKSANASDASQTKARSGLAVNVGNFRSDVTVNGSINASDVALVKSASGHAVP